MPFIDTFQILKLKIGKSKFKNTRILFILLYCTGVSSLGCGQTSVDSKRRATMLKVIDAIKINDTSTIGRLVDTANFFKTYGKENYYSSIKKLFKKFSKNEVFTTINENSFNSAEERSFGTTYQIKLYTSASKTNYYELTLRFVGDSFDRIYSFTSYFHNENPETLIQAP